MINYNFQEISEIHYDSHQIDEVYIGSLKVFPESGPTPPTPYENEYFTMVVTTGGDIKWSGSTSTNTLSYSKDNGETWTSANSATTIALVAGDKILWKGTSTPSYGKSIGNFSGDTNVRYSVEGNIMSLLYGDEFVNQTSLEGKELVLAYLFSGNTNVTSAENLVLPATTLARNCYREMFYNCRSLTKAPSVLPATTLANYCYISMFQGCSSLTTAPVLPATTLVQTCYSSMFYGCTSLTTAPELPATTLSYQCYKYMFRDCSNLNYIKCLATSINATECTTDWVRNVASSGTFTKAASMTSWSTGSNGIPSGWTIQNI